jgi:hypothetical protein
MNPLRGKMVEDLKEYRWSSHRYYADKGQNNELVDMDRVLQMFSEDKTTSRRFYRDFMQNPVKREDVYAAIDQRVLGDELFLDSVMNKYDGEIKKEKKKKEYTLGEIAGAIEGVKGVTLKQIRMHNKKKDTASARKLFALAAREYGYSGKEIADHIRRDPAIISASLRDRDLLKEDMEGVFRSLKKLNSQV